MGVDLLPIEPIPGSVLIQADFTDPGVDQQLIDELGGAPDLVLSDMAHNTVGHRKTDHLKIIALIEIAADFRHAVADHAPICLDLRFAGAAEEAKTAALAFKVGPAAHQSPRLIIEMRKFDL